MSSARFADKLLAAREARQELLCRALSAGRPATLFVSLNLPGPDKSPPGATGLFRRGCAQIAEAFPGSLLLATDRDALGHFALRVVDADPLAVKRLCIELEQSHPAGRLLDLDVYASETVQIGRASLGLPARRCLLCDQPAVDCMRTQRHAIGEVIAKAHELLAPFGA
ncbi:MAG: citrate lyase holo-[acyl-carrier protein] synthase [Dechloromonas sp.]|uniref:citrate lyase holo-[acyl-carrier protein] synthase n=1 Tax=Dechloromonas sp. TaxID=1917218 RepID=UPI0027F1FB42|nr:citrate lyase holo-[acyl-carrier protein] synthase [Dechloromonas sp.]MBT9521355.1 citrate lyase holo-[acyl-carrier protein] synthase [Dechloromonas sp.]